VQQGSDQNKIERGGRICHLNATSLAWPASLLGQTKMDKRICAKDTASRPRHSDDQLGSVLWVLKEWV
jgi:hypothetical protein